MLDMDKEFDNIKRLLDHAIATLDHMASILEETDEQIHIDEKS